MGEPSSFARLLPNLHWRWTCPDNVDDIASDFVQTRSACSLKDWANAPDDGFALRRRISAIYGVAEYYRHTRHSFPGPGWNRRLWKTAGEIAPEQLVDDIFDRVVAKVANR